MNPRNLHSETMMLFLSGVGIILFSLNKFYLSFLFWLYPTSAWGKRSEILFDMLIAYGFIFLILSVISFFQSQGKPSYTSQALSYINNLAQRIRNRIKYLVHNPQKFAGFPSRVLIAVVIGVVARTYFLSQPMRGDEAYSFLKFANGNIQDLFNYSEPNNHILNTILVRISTLIWGVHPATIRFPVFIAGVLSIPLLYGVAREHYTTPTSGLLAIFGFAIHPYFVLYATNARGYSIIVFFTMALALVGLRFIIKPSGAHIFFLSCISALGMFTIPTMALSIAGITCWLSVLLILKGRYTFWDLLTKYLLPFSLLTGIFTFILYTPVIVVNNGVTPITSNKFVQSQIWQNFFPQLIPQIQMTLQEFNRDIPAWLLWFVAIFAGLGVYRSFKERDWNTLLLLPALLIGASIIVFIQRILPYSRTWIYLIPFYMLIADVGFAYIIDHTSQWIQPSAKVTVIILAALLAIQLIATNKIVQYPDTSAFPEAPIVAQYLTPILNTNDHIKISRSANVSVEFYLWYYGLPRYKGVSGEPGRTFFVVKKSRYSIGDLTNQPVTMLLDFGDMSLYQLVEK
jgi:hypothetical protein